LDFDHPRCVGFGQSEGEDAVAIGGRDFLRLDAAGQLEDALKRLGLHFLVAQFSTFRAVNLDLAADGELLSRGLDVEAFPIGTGHPQLDGVGFAALPNLQRSGQEGARASPVGLRLQSLYLEKRAEVKSCHSVS
jgi:hypothetical protein